MVGLYAPTPSTCPPPLFITKLTAAAEHVLNCSSHHSRIIAQSIHFMSNTALQLAKITGRSCKYLVL